ncbi:hypothetical protein ACLMJK_009304 [Lecanora helva]
MPLGQTTNGESSPQTEDPWDWTVEQVVFALTNGKSSLLKNNSTLSLPDATQFAHILYENDVNGLALLKEVNSNTIRDELKIKSMSHRASINHLVQELQEKSQKYKEYSVKIGRAFDSGSASRLGTPFLGLPQHYDPSVPWGFSPWHSPGTRSDRYPNNPWTNGATAGAQEPRVTLGRNILADAPELPPPDWRKPCSAGACQETGGIVESSSHKDDESPAPGGSLDASSLQINSGLHADDSLAEFDSAPGLQHSRQNEVTVVDEMGRTRRRLVLASADPPRQAEPECNGTSSLPDGGVSSESAEPEYNGTKPLPDGRVSSDSAGETLTNAFHLLLPTESNASLPDNSGPTPEPGVVTVDEGGRKRLRPVVLVQPELSLDDPSSSSFMSERIAENRDPGIRYAQTVSSPSDARQANLGRKATRAKDQVYLGPAAFPVDDLFYGDVPFESELGRSSLDEGYTSDNDDLTVFPNSRSSNGTRLYVNARMKYYLQSPRTVLQAGHDRRDAIIPYPGHIGKKYYPLSVTTFKRSSSAISVFRSNRMKWMKDISTETKKDLYQGETDAFHVADPCLAQDEEDDSEWKALEKWNHVENGEELLPLYGESGSEGEYELETWREIEKEQGQMTRPTEPSRSRKLSAEEVKEIMNTAIEGIVKDWGSKVRPKLQAKAWRLWMRSRRDGTAKVWIRERTDAVEKLDKRLNGLHKEIMQEEWSEASHITRQCKIMQPTIFDLEDKKWEIDLLASRTKPERITPTVRTFRPPKPTKINQNLGADEEELTSNSEVSEGSTGSLDGFIIDDESEEDDQQIDVADNNLSMADVEDVEDSETILDESHSNKPTQVQNVTTPQPLIQVQMPSIFSPTKSASENHVVDLTLDSDTLEPEIFKVKPEPDFEIKTPPVNTSENESDAFERSRKKKAIFKNLHIPQSTNIINLESDSDSSAAPAPTVVKKLFPELSDVVGIKKMDPSLLVERQDRKRLLTWLIAHSPKERRRAASSYLTESSLEKVISDTDKALNGMLRYKRRLPDMDKDNSEIIMSIAAWRVCWTIPVKADEVSGLKESHVKITLADKESFDSFHDSLLDCLSYCEIALGPSESFSTPKKEKHQLSQASKDLAKSKPFHKKRHPVPESQETLNKRQAAQARMEGDALRRRKEKERRKELAFRLQALGRRADNSREVILNPGKHDDQDYIRLNLQFGNGVPFKEHQKEGLQFLWREITGDHEDLQGCLLAQTMGLGKTMQVIALIVTLAEASRSDNENICNQIPPLLRESRTLVLCPPALLENWWDEFLIWAPQPFSFGELRKISVTQKLGVRLHEVREWSDKGGVLLIGYDTFKALVHNEPKKVQKTDAVRTLLSTGEHEVVKEAFLQRATLVVADEAHTFKGRASKINSAMTQFRTRSRVALTGSPLSNNLEEYYTLVDWIAPNYLGNHAEFRANYEEPIQAGLYKDSNTRDYHRSRTTLKALEIEMEPKVHRANASVLHTDLQGKVEFVVKVPLTKLQEDLYRIFVDAVRGSISMKETRLASLWVWLGILQLLCNHPKLFKDKMLSELGDPVSRVNPVRPQQDPRRTSEEFFGGSDEDADTPLANSVTSTAFAQIMERCEKVFQDLSECSDERPDAPVLSNKMQVLMNIVELSAAAKDKVLVFSHRIGTLDYIQEELKRRQRRYVRIDGSLLTQKRQPITKEFNEGNIDICLISTRAGGTGLNLYGANRVVILDESFNPAHEMQAIGRAYRIGQLKCVYVYRLTAGGTFEQVIQNQALFKEQLADRVVDRKNPSRGARKDVRAYLLPPKEITQEPLEEFVGKDTLVLDHLLADPAQNPILSIIPSETLHIEDDMPLTDEMRMDAERMVANEQLRRRDPRAYEEKMRKEMRSAMNYNNTQTSTFISTASAFLGGQTGPRTQFPGSKENIKVPPSITPQMPQNMGGLPYPSHGLPDYSTSTLLHAHSFAADGLPIEELPQVPFSELNLSGTMPQPEATITPTQAPFLESDSAKDSNNSNAYENGPDPANTLPAIESVESPVTSANPPGTEKESEPPEISRSQKIRESIGNFFTRSASKDEPNGADSPAHETEEVNAARNSTKDNNHRKRSLPVEQTDQNKRQKSATPRISPQFNSTGPTETAFQNLLDRENSRSSKSK